MGYPNFSVKDLPENERPRERLMQMGASSLSLSEIIAIILGNGYSGEPATSLAQKLVMKYGDANDIGKLTAQELLAVKGIGVAKACKIAVCFELARRLSGGQTIKSKEYTSASDIHNLVKPYLLHREKEHFVVVSFDTRRRLIAVDNLSIGTVNESLVHPREVFKTAINRRASYIALVHNHPSGDVSPSNDDIVVTERLLKASYTMGIPVVDHLIVTDNAYKSVISSEMVSALK
ncbi:hypothetical protein A2982_01695 [candidate division WWE3 bacterium RIFCSPLOWO2_01_FULL_39_13]|uniref:MPN domain-containing protein n=1 Tax=candidate division WWE3 bacterium RIFCSPLOWO2_01_FULL_39_13 TaxID=1802624 RepID=A0A1F4V4N8_UNCKA|nr:MAG: hypothetical protein A2982_01695 [candidate division WWE3 bacterium RIFCSPLOWO2_01_FULL_39_13]